MAEAHPVGFQWVMEAKARGATVIHVDPRFSRTSAVADLHVPIRAGADIALVGGLINYVLSNEKYFHDYVLAYTNAPMIITAGTRFPASDKCSSVNVKTRYEMTIVASTRKKSHGFGQPACTRSIGGVVFLVPTAR